MGSITNIYNQFLALFPPSLAPLVNVILAILIIYGIIKVIQKDFVWIILLIILLPASVPILTHIWESLVSIVTFLLGKK